MTPFLCLCVAFIFLVLGVGFLEWGNELGFRRLRANAEDHEKRLRLLESKLR